MCQNLFLINIPYHHPLDDCDHRLENYTLENYISSKYEASSTHGYFSVLTVGERQILNNREEPINFYYTNYLF